MGDEKKQPGQPGQQPAYTGDTIIMPRAPEEIPGAQPGARPAARPQPDSAAQPQARQAAPAPRQQPHQARRPVPSAAGRAAAPPARPALRPQRARRSAWAWVRLLVLAGLALALVLTGLAYAQVRGIAGQTVVRDVRPTAPLAGPLVGGTNILIVGVDERPDHPEEGVRSDTLIVAHLDSSGWASLLSIPRDSLADVPGVGATKINVAYGQGYATAEPRYGAGTTPQQGGMALAAETVEQFLGWPARGQRIDYIAQVNFDGFAAIIDALGGVTINVPKLIVDEEYPTEDFGTQRVEFQPGPQRMDGARALIYARTRHADSDFDRGARQQQVIQAIFNELRARGPLGIAAALPRLGAGLEGTVATTMPFDRPDLLLGLLAIAGALNPDEIGQVRLSPEIDPALQQDAAFNLIWSEAGKQAAVDALLAAPGEANEAAVVQVLNGTGVNGLAGRITNELEDAGFTMLPAGDAPSSDTPQTLVYDIGNKPRTSRRLASTLGAQLRQGAPEGVATNADVVVVLGHDAVE